MMPYSEMALPDLLDAFASNEPVPGGGSAAALAGALGVSLLIKVAGLPRTRTGSPEEAADLSEASARLRPMREALTGLIDDNSNGASLDTMRHCQQALRGAIVIARSGNRTAATDTTAAVELLRAGLRSAGMNVDANLAGRTDAELAARFRAERNELLEEGETDARQAIDAALGPA